MKLIINNVKKKQILTPEEFKANEERNRKEANRQAKASYRLKLKS